MSAEQPTSTAPPAAAPVPVPETVPETAPEAAPEVAASSEAAPAPTTSTPPPQAEAKAVTTEEEAKTAEAKPETETQAQPQPQPPAEETPKETSKEISKETSKAPKPDEPTKVTPIQDLWATAKAHEHPEIWGVTLADPSTHIPSQIVLQKYLNANDGDLVKARDQLTKTLDWRKKTQPLELIKQTFSKDKFGGLGYVTVHHTPEEGDEKDKAKEIFTWNVYGNVKAIDVTFGDLNE